MALIKCPECLQDVSEKAVSCPRCGFPISNDECHWCKKSIPFKDKACPHCGLFQPAQPSEEFKQPTTVIAKNPKSRSMAVLLAMILGGIGLHKFYLNKPGAGVLYLLFCWTFIPVILGFFEGLSYLSMSDKDFVNRYC